MTLFVDTNIFLRYITSDDLDKQAACAALFERAKSGEIDLITSDVVIAEIVHVLSSQRLYNLKREAVFEAVNLILGMPGLRVQNRQVCVRAVYLYAYHNIDFADALIGAFMENDGVDTVMSYDKHMDRISTIKRVEP